MALPSQIDAAMRRQRQPVGLLVFDRQVVVAAVGGPDDDALRAFAVGLCDAAIRHKCNANEPEQGDACTNRNHARDVAEARKALILAGLAPDPYPSVERPKEISCAVPIESKRAMARRLKDEAEVRPPRPDLAWQDRGACRRGDPELFYPADGERSPEKAIREAKAKAVCAVCPVRRTCLDYAVERRELGVWGATNDDERMTVRRRRARRAKAAA